MNHLRQSSHPMLGWLSLATVPFLGSLLVTHWLTEELMAMGQTSEEIFRGDRLPILNFPESSEATNPEIH